MTSSNHSAIVPSSTKSSWFSGCILTILAVLFGLLGIFDFVYGLLFTYIFFSARMLSPASIAMILIIACDCVIYFILALRVKRQRWFVSLAFLVVAWLILPFPLRLSTNIATARVRIDGYAMEPALPNGSYILADRQAYQRRLPQRGDIIIFVFPADQGQDLIKRVIGLPGETVRVEKGVLTVNTTRLEEPYIAQAPLYTGEWTIPEGYYFVLGDNRNDSRDSHQWGLLPRENILSKAVWIYWPPAHFGKIVDINFAP